jgi:uncharacterized protein (DUF2062 family)
MITVLVLLTGSAAMGLVIGLKYRVLVIGLSAPVLAAVAAIALREFDFVAAAAITFACLTVSQMAYLLGAWLSTRRMESSDASLAGEQPDERVGENGQPGVRGEQNQQDKPPSCLASY